MSAATSSHRGPRPRRLLAAATGAAVVALGLSAARGEAPAAAAPALPSFGQPTISGIQGTGFEQDIRLDARPSLADPGKPRAIYTSAPGTAAANTSWIWRSLDGGRTFKWIPAATPTEGKVNPTCAGGGDTELAVDSAGRLYFADLTLANFSTARSDDQGQTFFACSNAGVPDALVDRQWYAADGDPTAGGNLYLASDQAFQGPPQCPGSNLNNVLVMYRSPAPSTPPGFEGILFGPANKITPQLSCDEAIMGNNEVSPVATRTGLNGQLLPQPVRHVYVIHDNAALNEIRIGRCFPVAFGPPIANVSDPSGLDCVDLPVASFLGQKTGANFPTMAIDRAGNLYAVWEQAPANAAGDVTGDVALRYAYSTDEGTTWSAPVTIPTPGLHNNVFAWPAAGDDGRVDVAFYGTPAAASAGDPCGAGKSDPTQARHGGPDATTDGIWSVYMVQTLNGHDPAGVAFTPPVLAGEHHNHKGTVQTIMGGQCGDRIGLGDFMQMRVGPQGEAEIAYADSNSITGQFASHGMFVRQTGGPGLYADRVVNGDPLLLNTTTDPGGDGRLEAAGLTSSNFPNLDILDSGISKPAAADCHPAGTGCYRVSMTLADLSLAQPGPPSTDTDLVWLTQWFLPAATSPDCGAPATNTTSSCQRGGKNFVVYAESDRGAAVRCYVGENAGQLLGGGVTLTYPGNTELAAPGACSVVTGPNGKITIDVPLAQVRLEGATQPLDGFLYSVTASTMTLAAPANTFPSLGGVGGIPFNLIDVARAYDATFAGIQVTALSLAPQTATNTVGSEHCVTATVADASGHTASGVRVRFSVSGANAASGAGSTDAAGQARFCYTGIAVGDDSIAAFADLDVDGTRQAGEPGDTAAKRWVAPPTTCEARVTDGGRITTDHGDKATFGGNADALGGTAGGQEQYTDHGPVEPLDLHSLSIVSISCSGDRTLARIFGQATVGGSGSVGYEIDVEDRGEPGGDDTYRIRLSTGYDSGRHRLDGGNVQIH